MHPAIRCVTEKNPVPGTLKVWKRATADESIFKYGNNFLGITKGVIAGKFSKATIEICQKGVAIVSHSWHINPELPVNITVEFPNAVPNPRWNLV